MRAATTPTKEDAEIRERIESLAQAISAKDVDALMEHYAPDVVTFDIRPPQQVRGVDAYRKNFETWFASVQGRIDYEMRELHIARNGDVAFCHNLSHVRSIRMSGEQADYWVRVTSGLRRTNGRWLIAHEHISMPIDMMSMRAVKEFQA
jgi:uncharacterized protein (TIGR02246 family)